MDDLANDPRTLSISTGPTFRQKGQALYLQLCRGLVPLYLRAMAQAQEQARQQFYLAGYLDVPYQMHIGAPWISSRGAGLVP